MNCSTATQREALSLLRSRRHSCSPGSVTQSHEQRLACPRDRLQSDTETGPTTVMVVMCEAVEGPFRQLQESGVGLFPESGVQ